MSSFWKTLLRILAEIFRPTPPAPPPPPPPPDEPDDPCPDHEPLDMPWCSDVGQTCSEPDKPCKHNPTSDPCYEEQALPCPPPDPPPPPDVEPGILEGTPQARVYWYSENNTADATPAICNPKRCDMVGYTGRYCCPPVLDNDPRRGELEAELMGGTKPVWELEVHSGDLRMIESDWFGQVRGSGKGRLRWHFPNMKATSKWLEVNR